MAYDFRRVDRDQQFLMPPSVDEWVPEGHAVRFVVDAVSMLDLGAFEAGYRRGGAGRRAFDPAMMVSLLLWAYSNGVFSSREIEQRCVSDVTFRFVTGNDGPDHATICRFRQTHTDALVGLHVQVLKMCAQVGLLRVGSVFLDGTKIKANASKDTNRSMDWLDAQIADWFTDAERVDDSENAEHGDRRGDETPEDVVDRAARLARLSNARDLLDERIAEKGPTTYSARPRRVNVTDPDSALMPVRGGGWVQGYNAQAVATADRVVVATSVTDETHDAAQLVPMIDRTFADLAAAGIVERPGTLVADAGYWSTETINNAPEDGPDLLIATGKRRDITPVEADPGAAAEIDAAEAARAQTAARLQAVHQHRREVLTRWAASQIGYRQAAAEAGVSVPRIYELRNQLAKDPNDRLGTRPPPPPPRPTKTAAAKLEMRQKLTTEPGSSLYKQRSPSIEGVFGDRKARLGFTAFSRRGITAAAAEWSLINTVGNLDKTRRALTAITNTLARCPTPT